MEIAVTLLTNNLMKYLLVFILLFCPRITASACNDTTAKTEPSLRNHIVSVRHTWYTSDYYLLGQHFGTTDYRNKGYPLGIALSYGRLITSRNYLGATLSFERQTGEWNNEHLTYTYKYGMVPMNHPVGNFTRNSLTFAFEYTHAYTAGKHVRLYTTVGMGITAYKVALEYDREYYYRNYPYRANELGNIHHQKRDAHFNAYYSPIGISVGGNVSWFAEVGFGYKGLMNTGFSYIF